jgi:hypothetical protein
MLKHWSELGLLVEPSERIEEKSEPEEIDCLQQFQSGRYNTSIGFSDRNYQTSKSNPTHPHPTRRTRTPPPTHPSAWGATDFKNCINQYRQ